MDNNNDLNVINKMYENLNYFDQYSGSLLLVIIITISKVYQNNTLF